MTAKKKGVSPPIIIVAVLLLIAAGAVGLVAYQNYRAAKMEAARLEDAYQKAVSIMEAGDYGAAVNLFIELGDYKDSGSMIQECYDAQSLENLRTLYQAIDTIYQLDNKLVSMVSTVISNVDKINSAGTKLQTRTNWAISSLYSGGSHRAYAQCSAYELASITAYLPSAQVSKGTLFYDVYIPLFSQEESQKFVDSIESGNTLMENLEEIINTENLSATYQDIQEQLLLAYDALKDYHSFVANEPTDYENYDTSATQKKTTVNDLLKNISSIVKTSK